MCYGQCGTEGDLKIIMFTRLKQSYHLTAVWYNDLVQQLTPFSHL